MNLSQKILGLLLITYFSTGCASYPFQKKSAAPGLLGTWKYKDSFRGQQTITLRANETYQIDFDGDQQTDVWGAYRVLWDKITFTDKKGDIPSDCREPGVYLYQQIGEQVHFTPVSDSCTTRANSLKSIWQKTVVTRN